MALEAAKAQLSTASTLSSAFLAALLAVRERIEAMSQESATLQARVGSASGAGVLGPLCPGFCMCMDS